MKAGSDSVTRSAVILAAAIALVSFSVLHLNGIRLTPDGWAYWQGAVSLVAGRGYTYFSGARIAAWPPLYSMYLAAWSLAVGPTALGIIIGNGILVTAQAALWCWTLLSIWREGAGSTPQAGVMTVVAVYLGLFIALNEQRVLADVLKYTLLPLLMLAGWKARTSADAAGLARWTMLSAMVATTLLLVHNDSIAFLAANSLVLVGGAGKRFPRVAAAIAAFAVPDAMWLVVRHALQQDFSHALGLGVAKYDALTYLLQAVGGTGLLLLPDGQEDPFFVAPSFVALAMAALFGVLVHRRDGAAALRFSGAFVGAAAAVTYALFNVSWVYDRLADRFLLFVPLAIVPLLLLAGAKWSRPVFVACAAAVLLPQFYWTATCLHVQTTSTLEELGYPTRFATPMARLSVAYRSGPPTQTEHGVVLAPNSFEEPGSLK
jgi:hypothetical protein